MSCHSPKNVREDFRRISNAELVASLKRTLLLIHLASVCHLPLLVFYLFNYINSRTF